MKYEVKFTNQFKKDLKLAKKQGQDLNKLNDVIDLLTKGERLEARYRDHTLTEDYNVTMRKTFENSKFCAYYGCVRRISE